MRTSAANAGLPSNELRVKLALRRFKLAGFSRHSRPVATLFGSSTGPPISACVVTAKRTSIACWTGVRSTVPRGWNGGQPSARTGDSPARERGTAQRAPNHQGTITEPSEESSLPPAVASDDADGFDAFWSAYPRKDEKKSARLAWARAVKRVEPHLIIEGARRYAADPNRTPQFTKQPPTWLNGDCWENGPLPSRTGLGNGEQRDSRLANTINNVVNSRPRQSQGELTR